MPRDYSIEVHRHNIEPWVLYADGILSYIVDSETGEQKDAYSEDIHLVESISIASSLDAPYSRLKLQMNWPLSLVQQGSYKYFGPRHPTIGDWIVVKSTAPLDHNIGAKPEDLDIWPDLQNSKSSNSAPPGPTYCNCFLGVVTGYTAKVRTNRDGAIEYTAMTVTAESWLDYLGRVQIGLLTDVDGVSIGTLIKRNSWLSYWQKFVENNATALKDGGYRLGDLLAQLLRMAARVRLPKSLFGADKYLGDVVRVANFHSMDQSGGSAQGDAAHRTGQFMRTQNDAGGWDWTRKTRSCEPIPGWKWMGNQSFNPQTTTVLDLLRGSFGADKLLIEFFPSMEATNDKSLVDTPTLQFKDNADTAPEEGISPSTGGSADLTTTGGFAPVLIYRMRPWRAESLQNFVKRTTTNSRVKNVAATTASSDIVSELRATATSVLTATDLQFALEDGVLLSTEDSPATMADLSTLVGIGDATISPGISTFGRYGNDVEHVFPSNSVFEVSFVKSVTDHITAATVDIINDPLGLLAFSQSLMGLPLFIDNEVKDHGLRMFRTQWPFWSFPSGDQQEQIDAINGGDLFAYWRWIGLTAWQFVGGMHMYHKGTAKVIYSPHINPGCAVQIFWKDPVKKVGGAKDISLYAYIEAVEHTVAANKVSGTEVRGTTITFTRGLFNEDFNDRATNKYENSRLNHFIPKAAMDVLLRGT